MNEKDRIRLLHCLDAIDEIEEYFLDVTDEGSFIANKMLRSATVRQLEVIGEAIGAIDANTTHKYTQIDWQDWKGFRNILIHQYFGVDYKIVFKAVNTDLKKLRKQLENILENQPRENNKKGETK